MNIKYYTREQLDRLYELLNDFDRKMQCPPSSELCSPNICKYYNDCRNNVDNLAEVSDEIYCREELDNV